MLYKSLNPHGGDVYSEKIELDFSSNINPLGIPGSVVRAVMNSVSDMHHYPDPFCRELVKAISKFEEVPEDYILCGNGAAELIYSYCEAAAPDKAMLPAPTFSEYSLGLSKTGCIKEFYYLDPDSFFDLDTGIIDHILQKRPDTVFVCNPNNPTGRLAEEKVLNKLLAQCSEKGIRLFIDETFLDLASGTSLKAYLSEYPGLFILKAFTKNFGIAGLRLGYALSSDAELLKKMSQAVQPWNVSVPAQAAGCAAMNEKAFLDKAVSFIKKERPWLAEQLEKQGLTVCPSDANYLLFYSEKELSAALRKRGIAIRDCSNYEGLEKGWYRVAVRPHEENEVLIRNIKEVLNG